MEYLIGPIAGILTLPVIFALAGSPVFALVLVLLVQDLRALGLGQLSVSLGAVNLTLLDLVYSLLLLAFIVRVTHRGNLNKFEFGWIVVGILGLIAFVRGLHVHGHLLAGDVRPTFYFTAAILYFMSVGSSRAFLNSIAKLWMINAVLLSLLAMFQMATVGIISANGAGEGLANRVLHATFAFQILQGALISLYLWITPGIDRNWRYLVFFLLPIMFMMQYRTVWIAALFAILLIALVEIRLRGRVTTGLSIIGLFAVVVLVPFYADSNWQLSQGFGIAASEAFSANSTITWRIAGWQALFANLYSFDINTFIGPPAGTARALGGINFLYAHVHSQYLLFLLHMGLLSFAIFIATYYFAVRRLRRSSSPQQNEFMSGRTLYVLLATQLVFYLTYNTGYEQYALLGIAISYLTRNHTAHFERKSAPVPYVRKLMGNAR